MLESFSAHHVHCEVYKGRWPGPNKRGRAILSEVGEQVQVLRPQQAAAYLQERFPEHFKHIEALIFYPQATQDESNPDRWLPFIACHTAPRFVARKMLFEIAAEVAEATGWYLLVSGRYLHREGQLVPGAFRRALPDRTPQQTALGKITTGSLHERPWQWNGSAD